MTPTTNGPWITDVDAYRAKLYDLLGDRDPLDVLAETPATLAQIVRDNGAEKMRKRPFDGKWTPTEIIGHLVDVEWAFGYRARNIFSDEQPTIIGIDQDVWVKRLRHNERDPAELVEEFRALREVNLKFWQSLSDEDLERFGQHAERGKESLGTMRRMLPGHDLIHINQIKKYLQAPYEGM